MSAIQVSNEALREMRNQSLRDGIIGCLFGSALGDAIGLYTEFLSAAIAAQVYPSRCFVLAPTSEATALHSDAHRDPHQPGEWTDDTDHALLILLSYLHKNGQDPSARDFATRLDIWVRQGLRALDTLPMGLGHTVGSTVRSKTFLEDPEVTARQRWKNSGYKAAANGSLMRTHPLGLMCLQKSLEQTFQTAADFSVITHPDPRCIISCAIGTALVRGLILHIIRRESDIDALIESAVTWFVSYRKEQLQDEDRDEEPHLDLDELWRHAKVGKLSDLELDEPRKIGYVYKTFGSGVHLVRLAMRETGNLTAPLPTQTTIFECLITDLIMLGGDADTNACFAGALVGAYLGFKALPPHWRNGLKHGEWLMAKAEGLCMTLKVVHGTYNGAQDTDTAPDGGRGILTDAQMEEKVMRHMAGMAQRLGEGVGKRKSSSWGWLSKKKMRRTG
ncbi:hypothetical protein V2A60_007484 [Cordyceps javanica]|uniref:ADP-ribosylglycohydrolase-like protein n=1 Tax=Cordyceps javanica TaxID=43265 RepID=A0A545W7Q1_9HYPO|nr:ADP-ribosylglycohydrolase-like protein [Cordyceps javanica]TQW10030.1 ADP-ribosylglycohydrolase-like protein [Cordyceps javanica]